MISRRKLAICLTVLLVSLILRWLLVNYLNLLNQINSTLLSDEYLKKPTHRKEDNKFFKEAENITQPYWVLMI